MKQNFKTGDTVKILSGDDKNKTGKVLAVDRVKGKALVEGINMMTHFIKKTEQTPNGGMIKKEGYIALCKAVKVSDGKAEKAPKAEKSAKKDDKKSLTKKA